jgi:hypothetical protein
VSSTRKRRWNWHPNVFWRKVIKELRRSNKQVRHHTPESLCRVQHKETLFRLALDRHEAKTGPYRSKALNAHGLRGCATLLQDLMLAEFAGLAIARDGHEVVPTWRVLAPDGDFLILDKVRSRQARAALD